MTIYHELSSYTIFGMQQRKTRILVNYLEFQNRIAPEFDSIFLVITFRVNCTQYTIFWLQTNLVPPKQILEEREILHK